MAGERHPAKPIRMWLYDHGSDWASRVGDVWSWPFTKLEAYCNRRWWEEQKRDGR